MKKGRRKVNPDLWLTPKDIAEKLSCHHNTPLNWCRRDGLRHIKVGKGGYIRIRKSDLQEFLDEFYPGLQI